MLVALLLKRAFVQIKRGLMSVLKIKRRQEPAESFVGWVSEDGKLEVVGIAGKRGNTTLFRVICIECSNDKELFPNGYFISTKSHLKSGRKPCGCSKSPVLSLDQQLIKVRRLVNNKFIIKGVITNYKDKKTRLDCECPVDGHKWTPTMVDVMQGYGCPMCGGSLKRTEESALEKCKIICDQENYICLGFPDGYKNKNSRFEYECKIHGKSNVSYNNFVNNRRKCKGCSKSGYNPNKEGSFYIVKWTNKNSHSFIKFGITNQKVKDRLRMQSSKTDYNYTIIFSETWKDGYTPLNIENSIKHSNLFSIGVIPREEFKDGFTETVELKDLDKLLEHIVEIIKSKP